MPTLIQLTKDLNNLAENDEVNENEFKDKIQITGEDYKSKVSNFADLDQALAYHERVFDAEIKRLQIIKKNLSNRRQWLRDCLLASFETLGLKSVKSGSHTVFVSKNSQPEIVVEIPAENLPMELVEVILKPDKKEILNRYRETGLIPNGVKIIEDKEHITIK